MFHKKIFRALCPKKNIRSFILQEIFEAFRFIKNILELYAFIKTYSEPCTKWWVHPYKCASSNNGVTVMPPTGGL